MGQALYRKYRSKSLDEVIGQPHITTTLKNALKSGKISHAYLFTGPKGVGKTSVARILAHELNSFDYDESHNHLDIIEIDAASNRRIDEIREIRDRVHTAPTSGKYKVYIIDEVHMLTKEAFNALLKTLEEPPAHAIFILATTEAHKLPDTIVSRTQRFTFKPIEKTDALKHLQTIAKQENIKIDDSALELIIEHADGSFRDSISLLDQVRNSDKKVTLSDVEKMLGVAPKTAILELLVALKQNDAQALMQRLDNLALGGSTPAQVAKQLVLELRNVLMGSTGKETLPISSLMRKLIDVQASHDPEITLQLVLLEAVLSSKQSTLTHIPLEPTPDKPTEQPTTTKPELPDQPTIVDNEPVTEEIRSTELWSSIVNEIKHHHNTLYSIARMAKSEINNKKLILTFSFPFHAKRLNEAKNKQIILDILHRLTGEDYALECRIESKDTKQKPIPAQKSDGISNISNIFGGVEVLES